MMRRILQQTLDGLAVVLLGLTIVIGFLSGCILLSSFVELVGDVFVYAGFASGPRGEARVMDQLTYTTGAFGVFATTGALGFWSRKRLKEREVMDV